MVGGKRPPPPPPPPPPSAARIAKEKAFMDSVGGEEVYRSRLEEEERLIREDFEPELLLPK